MSQTPPRVLAIAGSDSGGGAGIQADLKTMLALGVHGMTVICAVTAQNSLGVQGYWELPAEAVRAQLDSVLGDIGAQAVKTGMLASAEIVRVVSDRLADVEAPLVVDPVAVSKHGDPLLSEGTLDTLTAELLPLATVVTPNLLEAQLLTGMTITDEKDMLAAARKLASRGPRWVWSRAVTCPATRSICCSAMGAYRFSWPDRQQRYTRNRVHAASAIASHLAMGADVPSAVESAREYRRRRGGGLPARVGRSITRGGRQPVSQPVSGTFLRCTVPRSAPGRPPTITRAEYWGSTGVGCGGAKVTRCC
jgi:hydroxymethylpyrimidine/phosphomethylpyrimidine kinase